jgi:hypothetical protein
MPPMEVSDLVDEAVLWPLAGYDSYSEPTLGEPCEIPCRWVGKNRVVKDAKGNTITLVATVVVDRSIPNHSVLWRGCLDDLDDRGRPPAGSTLVTVEAYNETSDVKGRETRRSVDVSTFNGTLPAVVPEDD